MVSTPTIKLSLSVFLLFAAQHTFAQTDDTSKTINLKEVEIIDIINRNNVMRLNEVEGTNIYSGKKNEVIQVSKLDADLSTNNSRQIFSKVPGIMIWENDGSGIQTSIAARGLSPNRSWEFNMRQNGYDITPDPFGYPEAYYTPPTEALSRIEVVRGAGSLQYGSQFGGMVNYVFKNGYSNKPIFVETQFTTGNYGLFNAYNAIGGTIKKFSYYAFYHNRTADGWRDNSQYKTNTVYANVSYQITSKMKIGLEYTHNDFVSQQPGGLTDSLFKVDPKKSYRSRNWLGIPWNVMALTYEFNINENSLLTVKAFGNFAERNSVGLLGSITTQDVISTTTNDYANRQVDRDFYQNAGAEARFRTNYNFLKSKSTLSAGLRFFSGSTERWQQGKGTTGSTYDYSIAVLNNGKEYSKELIYTNINYAFFIENLFKITPKLSITPGVRYEMIQSTAKGYINTSATGAIPNGSQDRAFLLYGLGAQYHIGSATNLYANYSTAYRPVTYSELTPSATTDVIDPNLKDASGYNADFGYRGTFKNFLSFDVSGFYLFYNNRIGSITIDGVVTKTNIGASESKGIEAFIEADLIHAFTSSNEFGSLKVYTSQSVQEAVYTRWDVVITDPTKTIVDKKVENAPAHIGRYGLTYSIKSFSASVQMNQVSEVYTDAINTELPNAAATIGKIDGYTLLDASMSLTVKQHYNFKIGLNNITDEAYATRRSGGYPGPGLLPGNGRTYFVSVGAKF